MTLAAGANNRHAALDIKTWLDGSEAFVPKFTGANGTERKTVCADRCGLFR